MARIGIECHRCVALTLNEHRLKLCLKDLYGCTWYIGLPTTVLADLLGFLIRQRCCFQLLVPSEPCVCKKQLYLPGTVPPCPSNTAALRTHVGRVGLSHTMT